MLYVIFHLALETAMRQGEILALRWEHIDLRTVWLIYLKPKTVTHGMFLCPDVPVTFFKYAR